MKTKTIQKLKTLVVVFFIFTGGNLFAQNHLSSSLQQVEKELEKLNIKYKKTNNDGNSVSIGYKTASETKIYEFKINASNEFICYIEQIVMKYSEPLLEQTLSYFDSLGYDKTNYQDYMGNPVQISSSNSNHKKKHYLHLFLMANPDDQNETLLWVEFTLNTDEFKIAKE